MNLLCIFIFLFLFVMDIKIWYYDNVQNHIKKDLKRGIQLCFDTYVLLGLCEYNV